MIDGSYSPGVRPNSGYRGVQPHAPPGAAKLEVEIADLIKNAFKPPDQPDDWARQRAAWNGADASNRSISFRSEADGVSAPTDMGVELNRPSHDRPAWDCNIRIHDAEKLALVASSSAGQMRRLALITAVLSLALGIVWCGSGKSPQFVETVRGFVSVDQKVAARASDQPISIPVASVIEAAQQARIGSPSGGKIVDLSVSRAGAGRDSVVPSISKAKRAAGAPQNTASASTSAAFHHQPKTSPMPSPETKPTTIDGWVIREVTNGTAVLQGPNGVWKAARGDTVPGLGTVNSIVLWGSRWIVSTSRGLITTR